jgi:signal transduction histidine kinase/CheY-like chemotaxis protein
VSRSVLATLFGLVLAALLLFAAGRRDYPNLHTALDSGMFLMSGILALAFWDMGTRLRLALPRWIAISFVATSLLQLIHVLVSVEWSGALAPIALAAGVLRPSTWPPAAHLLPIGMLGAFLLLRRGAQRTFAFAGVLVLVGAALVGFFNTIPRYTPATWLDMTRPSLVLVPPLWTLVGIAAWRMRSADRLLPIIAAAAPAFVLAHVSMLYSRAPHDTQAMVAHLGVVGGSLLMLVAIMQMASVDMLERIRAERELAALNRELEQRVAARTNELAVANERVRAQVERLSLLQRVTRAIDERQDLSSILQVVVRSLEDQLAIDFSCICLYDELANVLVVTSVGVRSEALALELALTDQARVGIDQNGLSRCVRGMLVYEPDISQIAFPFPERLARGGLRALVVAPLRAESRVFGVVVAARRLPDSFSSGECEFVRQLSEHTALAAHQAQLHASLQVAYDDLRQTQGAVMQQERLMALGQMASGIAHDINNAIAPVTLYTESLLEHETNLSERGRSDLEIIQRAIDDVAQTVTRMGEFYRARDAQSHLAPVQLNRLAEHVIDLTRARWSDMPQHRGIVIEMQSELASDLPLIAGVESEIREALTNLVFNAVDAMPNGGRLTVRTFATATILSLHGAPNAQQAHIEVTDTGGGMSAETRGRCLEPFFTTKGDRGTGLGLAMVYGVVQRHVADIDIESAVGQGTTIRLSFPVPAAIVDPNVPAGPSVPLSSQRILIVDDDPIILRSLRDILEKDGHVVVAADGGQVGIDTFRAVVVASERFDLVITDLGMPHVDGRQVARAVKSASPSTPVLLLTGWGNRILADGDVPSEVDRLLAKPPRLRDLRDALAYCCSLTRA